MRSPQAVASEIADLAVAGPDTAERRLIAIAGPPASGKSTISAALVSELRKRGLTAALVAMDGFHLDNAILDARNLRSRKGAPETFDLAGFRALLERLRSKEEVIAPSFDRARDVSVGSSIVVDAETTFIVVEGNYLLLDEDGWRDLAQFWSLSVALSVSQRELERRLMTRWARYGFSETDAREKARSNDLPNAARVDRARLPADVLLEL